MPQSVRQVHEFGPFRVDTGMRTLLRDEQFIELDALAFSILLTLVEAHPQVLSKRLLLHGFGFASALTGVGLPRSDLPLALLNFNIGVEIGQLGFIALVLALERSFHVLQMQWPRWVELLPGYVVGGLGAFWTLQRAAPLLAVLR